MQIPGKKIFNNETFLTDWTSRGGDGLFLRGQRIDSSDSAMKVVVKVYTKNTEDTGKGSAITDGISDYKLEISATGTAVDQLEILPDASLGIKEMVRLEVSTSGGTADDEWILCRTFPIVWYEGAR